MQDLRDFRDAVKSTNIFEVAIKKSSLGTPRSDVFNNGRRSDPLLQMMSGGNIQTFRLSGWDEGFLGRIGTIPTTLTVRNLVIDMQYEDTRQKRIPRLVSILQASPVLSYLSLSAFHIDYYADRLLPALEKAKLPRELEVILESDDYSRVSFKVEAHTGRVRPIDVRYRSDCRTKFLYRPSVQHIHFVRPELLTTILGDLWLCLRNNTGLESVKVNCSSDDFIEWLQSIHRVFTDYSQLTTQLYFLGSKSTLSTCNIQDLSTTAIRLDRLSNKHLSAGYLGTVQDDWTFAVNMLVLATNTKPTDITTLAQFLRPRPDRFSFPALELTIDDESDLTIVPPLIKLLEECQALQDTRIRLNLNYEGRTRLFTDTTSQDAARHLTRFNSSVSRSNLVMEFF
ncbi:hypothetical protein BKA57DRAFT_525706 [Linnemannia elongata]|nr:hypothetical protein BKA57DRAFT_525706 [Linnemannia elongata]